jgi:hypothetical protein
LDLFKSSHDGGLDGADDVEGAANAETGIGGADGPGCNAEEDELAWDTGARPGCAEDGCATGDGDRLRQDGESASWIGSSSPIEGLR